jgi:hypothetical protein
MTAATASVRLPADCEPHARAVMAWAVNHEWGADREWVGDELETVIRTVYSHQAGTKIRRCV